MRGNLVIGIAVLPVIALTGCSDSATGGVKKAAAPTYAAARPVGQAFQLTDGAGDTAQLSLTAVKATARSQQEVSHRAGVRDIGLAMRLRAGRGQPVYEAAPVVIGTDHHTYFAKSNSSPPDATDITVAMPRHVRIACVRDTIEGARRVAQWSVTTRGCSPG